jgi:hypothetical protein
MGAMHRFEHMLCAYLAAAGPLIVDDEHPAYLLLLHHLRCFRVCNFLQEED